MLAVDRLAICVEDNRLICVVVSAMVSSGVKAAIWFDFSAISWVEVNEINSCVVKLAIWDDVSPCIWAVVMACRSTISSDATCVVLSKAICAGVRADI